MSGEIKKHLYKYVPGMMAALRTHSFKKIYEDDSRFQTSSAQDMQNFSRIGSMIPAFNRLSYLSFEQASALPLYHGERYLLEALGTVIAIGRRDIALEKLEIFADELAGIPGLDHTPDAINAVVEFIHGHFSQMLHSGGIDHDFIKTACEKMTRRLIPENHSIGCLFQEKENTEGPAPLAAVA